MYRPLLGGHSDIPTRTPTLPGVTFLIQKTRLIKPMTVMPAKTIPAIINGVIVIYKKVKYLNPKTYQTQDT
jgi:hypothetical protein